MVAIVLAIQGCGEAPRSDQGAALRGNVALPDDARAVIYLNNLEGYDEAEKMHGTVVIVRSDGAFDTMSTAGISDGSLLYADGAVYGSDRGAEFRISADGTEWRERADEQLLQESVLAMPDLPVVVFNSGVRRGGYSQALSGWGPDTVLRGEVEGEPGDMTTCNGRSIALTTPWRSPGRRADLYELVVADGGIETTRIRTLDLRSSRGILGIYCVGRKVFALEGGPRDQRIGLIRAAHPPSWRAIEGPPIFGVDCGVAGDDIVMIDYERGGALMALDARNRRTRVLGQLPGDDWVCATDGDQTMVVVDGHGDDPVLQWYDSAGKVVDELSVDGLGDYMALNDEALWGDPAIVSRSPH